MEVGLKVLKAARWRVVLMCIAHFSFEGTLLGFSRNQDDYFIEKICYVSTGEGISSEAMGQSIWKRKS